MATDVSTGVIRAVPRAVAAVTVAASAVSATFGAIQGWPLWAVVTAGLLPWLPLLGMQTAWTYRHYHWLALFGVLMLTQGGHVIEHVVQMVQLHVLHSAPAQSRGVFGALDIEWVHVVWNTLVLASVVALTVFFRRNPWLLVTLAFAVWHQAEHLYIMARYLDTGAAGDPGLLAKGGVIGGGVGIVRPDLHFLYNIIETTPLTIAFVYQLRRARDRLPVREAPA